MRTQLQAVSLRIQTVRSNEQMMQSMKGATSLLGSMNRQMRLPALQKIAMEFERENDIMDQRQEMMDDAIDDVTGLEDEEEGEEVIKEVLDEIGGDLSQSVSSLPSKTVPWLSSLTLHSSARHQRVYRRKKLRTDVWHKQSVVVGPRKMTTCKHALTACEKVNKGWVWSYSELHNLASGVAPGLKNLLGSQQWN